MKTTRIGKLASALAVTLVSFATFGGLMGPFTETVGGITWTYSVRDGVAVLGYEPFVKRAVHPTTAGALTIPAALGGYPVREIGEYAFHSCQKLTSVTIQEGVTTIAPRSFSWCGISSLNLPKSVSKVTGEAFVTSGKSEEEYSIAVTVTAGNEHYKTVDGFLLTKDGTELVFSPMLKSRAALPSTVKRIGVDAFCNHIRLEEVILPASVGAIGASAFLDCVNLKKIVFGGNAPTVGDSAFGNTSATGYVGVGTMGWSAVPGVWNGVSLVYGKDNGGPYTEKVDGVEWTYYVVKGGAEPRRGGASHAAISTNTVGSVEIPGSLGGRPVTSVGNCSFYECDKVTDVAVPETVTNIAGSAFALCGVRTVKLPDYLAAIGQDSFSWSGFRSLTIPEGVKEIPYYALSYCKSMTSVALPSTLEKIGDSAFIRDNSLTSLYIPAAVRSIGDEGLSCCPNLTLTVDPDNKTFKMIDGFLMSKDGTELVCCPGGVANGTIPAGTQTVRRNAFRECMRVTKIVIPEGVTNIGYMAFCFMDNLSAISFPHSYRNTQNTMLFGGGYSGNAIRDVAMPGEESIKSLFSWNSAATNLVIIAGSKTVVANAFQGCTTIETVTLPDGLQRIEDYSFAGCTALKSVTIPSSVTYIGPRAFDGCTSLSRIALPGMLPTGVSESGLLAQATDVSCERADVKTVQGLVPDGCDVYFWTTNGQRMKVMGNPPPAEEGEESVGIVMEVRSFADSGEGTLREALSVAQDGDMILFDLDEGSEIVLSTPLVVPSNRFSGKGLTIGGDNGGRCVTVMGNGSFQLLTLQSGNKVFVDGVTFKNGKGGFGGAIGNYGALTVRNCGFMDNESPSWGGAIANYHAASCFVQNCDFVGNRCGGWGGAVVSHTTSLTTVLGCRFMGNVCDGWGGAIAAFSTGDMLIINCEIHENQAYGGAVVAQSDARVTIIGSNVTDNEADFEGADVFNLGGTVNAIGSMCRDNYGQVSGTVDLKPVPGRCSSLVGTDAKALGNWYSQVVDASGRASMQLNAQACPRFAARTDGKPVFEVTEAEYVTMKVENVKPLLYYGLAWSETPGGEFVVEPGMWVQADANGVLPSDVRAPKGTGASRFFRVKVTDDPTVAK